MALRIAEMTPSPKLAPDIYAAIRDSARRFAEQRVRPLAAELDRTEAFPRDLYREMGKLGLLGITAPEDRGGAGLDVFAYALVMEELSRGYASVADQCGLVELVATLLTTHGTPDQQERHLPPVLTAERLVAYAITEAEAGSDVSGIKTIATRDGEGWRLSGAKLWIHNAPVADTAFVLARTDAPAGHRGMSIFMVDLDAEGVARGRKEHKMGQCASPCGALVFDHVKLPGNALLGPLNRGFHIMMSVLDKGRIGIAALAVGIAQAGLEAALDHAKTRSQFGQTIIENQGLQWILADMAKDTTAARALVHRAALLMDQGLPATMD